MVLNTRVVTLRGFTKWSSQKYPCQKIVSHIFYCIPTIPIQCRLWDCRACFVKDTRAYISLCWFAIFLSSQKVDFSFNLSFPVDCWFGKNRKLVRIFLQMSVSYNLVVLISEVVKTTFVNILCPIALKKNIL